MATADGNCRTRTRPGSARAAAVLRARRPATFETLGKSSSPGPLQGAPFGGGDRRQVFDLLLGDAEPDSVRDGGDGADRDGDLLAPPQVALLEQDVGHGVVAAIHHKAFYLPDLTVDSVHVLVPPHFGLANRNGVADQDGLTRAQAEAGSRADHPEAARRAEPGNRHGLAAAVVSAAVHHL